MSTALPTLMKACVSVPDGSVELKRVPVLQPGPHQVLVKVIAAAQNPSEYMVLDNRPSENLVIGHDFAGIVEAIGPGIPIGTRQVGERVASFLGGGLNVERSGTFAEYCVADAYVLLTLPDSMTFEEGSTLGLGGFTAAQTLWQNQKLPTPNSPSPDGTPILIWGGASSVGQFAIQLAAASGLSVITTASPRNHELMKTLGASHVFDYNDPDVAKKVQAAAGGSKKLQNGVDCISAKGTPDKVKDCLGESGGYIALVLPAELPWPNVRGDSTLVFTLLGKPILFPFYMPPSNEDYEAGKGYAKMMTEMLRGGQLRGNPTKIVPHGLKDVKKWLDYQKAGKISADKVVYRITETPEV